MLSLMLLCEVPFVSVSCWLPTRSSMVPGEWWDLAHKGSSFRSHLCLSFILWCKMSHWFPFLGFSKCKVAVFLFVRPVMAKYHTEWLKWWFTFSQFWRPEVRNQVASKVCAFRGLWGKDVPRPLSTRSSCPYVFTLFSLNLCLCVQIPSFDENTGHTGLDPLQLQFKPNHLFQDPLSKCHYILTSWGLGGSTAHALWWGGLWLGSGQEWGCCLYACLTGRPQGADAVMREWARQRPSMLVTREFVQADVFSCNLRINTSYLLSKAIHFLCLRFPRPDSLPQVMETHLLNKSTVAETV